MSEIPKAYEPSQVETKWYQFWLERGYFTPRMEQGKEPFVIIMPPPNVTGELHMGHALTATLEDIMTRWHRMKGNPALWLPGVDHAGIATQVVVEQRLAGEGLTRHELGREKFLERVWQWESECRGTIAQQHQRLGVSCDWSRERFTMDEGPSRAVRTAFVRLFQKGLIYRGERLINWCPRCQTALSDLEVQHKEIAGHLYYIHYPLVEEEGEKGCITVATTRPETFLGDTAVAVNPEDKRFESLRGREVVLPIIGRVIPIVADSAVDPTFGTGAVKVTPAHDPVDFELSQRHGLPLVNILRPDASMNENAGPYMGLDRFACREAVLSDLEKQGLLLKIDPHSHSVGHCDRCQTMIEPMVSKQWFVQVAPLAQRAIEAVRDGRITIVPERFTKVYLNWMENIRDWCISRQLWWGHRIPVWYCSQCGELTVAVDDPSACSHCGSESILQDPDVLDTWFSSALWPHSTLGWPENTEDMRQFYPTSVMETGYDILFFWVARMIMMGLEDTGDIPFRVVYLHGLVRDEKGDKMSKIRGNVLNPVESIDRYGTDALRFALSTGSSPGNDIKISPPKLEAGRNFANKLWNATRFVLRSLGEATYPLPTQVSSLTIEDRWIWSRVHRLVATVDELMTGFQFGEAERRIHDFLWGEFCDWYIEIAKIRLRDSSQPSPLPTLLHVLEISLRLLHPFMPFISEELWQHLKPHLPEQGFRTESVMVAPYPMANETAFDAEAERTIEAMIEIIRSIRNVRAQFRMEPAQWIKAQVYAEELLPVFISHSQTIETLARARPLAISSNNDSRPARDNTLVLVLKEAEVWLTLAQVDLEAEKQRLLQEVGANQAVVARLRSKLEDSAFRAKAPPSVVEREEERLSSFQEKLERLKQQLAQLNYM